MANGCWSLQAAAETLWTIADEKAREREAEREAARLLREKEKQQRTENHKARVLKRHRGLDGVDAEISLNLEDLQEDAAFADLKNRAESAENATKPQVGGGDDSDESDEGSEDDDDEEGGEEEEEEEGSAEANSELVKAREKLAELAQMRAAKAAAAEEQAKQAAAERIRAELVKESEPELDDATKASR
eukprot:COSAG04_NODE_1307_length_7295_cov_1.983185_2_plen_189_part_00